MVSRPRSGTSLRSPMTSVFGASLQHMEDREGKVGVWRRGAVGILSMGLCPASFSSLAHPCLAKYKTDDCSLLQGAWEGTLTTKRNLASCHFWGLGTLPVL